jgi:hypothetical protein
MNTKVILKLSRTMSLSLPFSREGLGKQDEPLRKLRRRERRRTQRSEKTLVAAKVVPQSIEE